MTERLNEEKAVEKAAITVRLSEKSSRFLSKQPADHGPLLAERQAGRDGEREPASAPQQAVENRF